MNSVLKWSIIFCLPALAWPLQIIASKDFIISAHTNNITDEWESCLYSGGPGIETWLFQNVFCSCFGSCKQNTCLSLQPLPQIVNYISVSLTSSLLDSFLNTELKPSWSNRPVLQISWQLNISYIYRLQHFASKLYLNHMNLAISSHYFSLKFILILFSHICLFLPSGVFPPSFLTYFIFLGTMTPLCLSNSYGLGFEQHSTMNITHSLHFATAWSGRLVRPS
jgi:hypothetical protein